MSIRFPVVAYYLDYKSTTNIDSLELQKEEVRCFVAKLNREYACQNNLYNGRLYNQCSKVLEEFTERVYDKIKMFPKLSEALDFCRAKNAELVIARVTPVYRNKFFTNLLLKYQINFHCLEVKTLNLQSLRTVLDMYAVMKKRQSIVIKNALQAARKPLGNPNALQEISKVNKPKRENAVMFSILLSPIIDYYQQQPRKFSQREIVKHLNLSSFNAPEGGTWVLSQIQKVLERINMNNFVMSISEELEYCQKKGYTKSQTVKALKALNLQLPSKQQLTEVFLDKILERYAMIEDITEFNYFIVEYLPKLSKQLKDKVSLNKIANELNEKKVLIPKRIKWELNVDRVNKNNKEKSAELIWNSEVVELVICVSERRKRDIVKMVNESTLNESKRLIEEMEN